MGGGVSTDFKSSNRIEISQLLQVLLNFYWFWGGGRWVDRGEGGYVWGDVPCMHVHAHMHMHDKHGCLHVGGHLQFLYMYTCICICFGPKKVHLFCSCDPLIKNVPIFALDPFRPYFDWALRGFLTSKSIYDPFKFDLKWRPKCKIRLKCQFAIEPSTTKNRNVPLDALMCPLQIINWHWTPIIDPSWCKCTLCLTPIQCWKLLYQS